MLGRTWGRNASRSDDVVAEQAWRSLRRLRSAPPGAAVQSTARRSVFSAALEQSEQLFRAGARADAVVRPMLLFYGVSQAVRAITAAAVALPEAEMRPGNHGASSEERASDVADVQIKPRKRNARKPDARGLAMLQQVLGRAAWTEAVSLAQVWAANPALVDDPLPGVQPPPAIRVAVAGASEDYPSRNLVQFHQIPSYLAVANPDEDDVDRDLLEPHYPKVLETTERIPSGKSAGAQALIVGPSTLAVTRLIRDDDGLGQGTNIFQEQVSLRYHGTWILPALGGTSEPADPLVLWWSLLFALSNRARYEPEGWTNDLDVDRSTCAVPLEAAMNIALAECPEQILRAIRQVSGDTT